MAPKTPAASPPKGPAGAASQPGGAFALGRPGGEPTRPGLLTLHWAWQRFAELGVDGVYDMLALRARVFILEQGPFLDPDGFDRQSGHLLGRDAAGELQAYLRIVDPGLKYAEPSMGRVVLAQHLRGSGLADQLVAEGLARAAVAWPGLGNRISAQAHLQGFYGRHRFEAVGAEYIEDTIPHIEMWRQA